MIWFYSHINLILKQVVQSLFSFLTPCTQSNTSTENGMESDNSLKLDGSINAEKIRSQSQILCFQFVTSAQDQRKCICRPNGVWVKCYCFRNLFSPKTLHFLTCHLSSRPVEDKCGMKQYFLQEDSLVFWLVFLESFLF